MGNAISRAMGDPRGVVHFALRAIAEMKLKRRGVRHALGGVTEPLQRLQSEQRAVRASSEARGGERPDHAITPIPIVGIECALGERVLLRATLTREDVGGIGQAVPVRDRTPRTLRGQAQADHIPIGEIGNVERPEWSAVASFGEVSFPALFGARARIEDFLHFGFTLLSNPHSHCHRVEQLQGVRIHEKAEAVESSQMLEHLLGDLSRIGQFGRDAKVFEGSDHGVFLRIPVSCRKSPLENPFIPTYMRFPDPCGM